MTWVYDWKVKNGDDVKVEYCWSTVDDCIKIVEMRVNGKFHRETWMSQKGRDELHQLLTDDYMDRHGYEILSQDFYTEAVQLLQSVTFYLLFICNIITNLQYDWK